MARTRVRYGRVLALLSGLMLGVVPVARIAQGSTPAEPPRPRVHVVEAGDTLWAIARGLVGPEGDPRPVIEEIREANDLSAPTLVPGRRLVLPGG